MKDLIGKKINYRGVIHTVLDVYVTDTAGVCLLVVSEVGGKATLDTLRVYGSNIEIIP